MKLHANARLSLKGRELLVERVSSRGGRWRRPPRRPESATARARKWLAPLPGRGRSRVCWIAPRRRQSVANRTDERGSQAIAALRRLRFTGAEIAECSAMPLSTVSGILTRIGMGKLGRLGLEPAAALRARAPRRADPHRRQEARAGSGGAGHRITGDRGRTTRDRPRRRTAASARLGVRARRDRRRHPPGLRRGPRRREGHHRVGFLRRAVAHFAATASPSSA